MKVMGKTNEAINHYCQTLEIKPNLIKTHQNLVIALMEQDRILEAAKHADKMLTIFPKKRLEIYNDFGELLLKHQEPDLVLNYFDKAIESFPDEPQAYFNCIPSAEVAQVKTLG